MLQPFTFENNSDTLKSWYDSTMAVKEEPDFNNSFSNIESKTPKQDKLSDLMMNAIKLRTYASFLGGIADSIEMDIKADVTRDIFPVDNNPHNPMPSVTEVAPQLIPLKSAYDKKDAMVDAATNIGKLVNDIVAVISKVKFKEG